MPYTLKIKIRKSRRRTRRNIRRHTQKRTKGGANLIVDYSGLSVIGQNFKKSATTVQPAVKFTGEPGKLYTLVMWDPDVPAKIQPVYAHWIAINLKSQNNIASNELLSYQGPARPHQVRGHIAIFLVYLNKKGILIHNNRLVHNLVSTSLFKKIILKKSQIYLFKINSIKRKNMLIC